MTRYEELKRTGATKSEILWQLLDYENGIIALDWDASEDRYGLDSTMVAITLLLPKKPLKKLPPKIDRDELVDSGFPVEYFFGYNSLFVNMDEEEELVVDPKTEEIFWEIFALRAVTFFDYELDSKYKKYAYASPDFVSILIPLKKAALLAERKLPKALSRLDVAFQKANEG